jgi:tetratricopeptide (TPR) repeat protein
VCAVSFAILVSCNKAAQSLSAAELLSLGEKYLLELDYEQAVVQFLNVIEIEPKNPRGYLGAAEVYIALDESDKAFNILRQGLEATDDQSIAEYLSNLERNREITDLPQTIQSLLNEICSAYLDGDKERTLELQSSLDLLEFCKELPENGIIIHSEIVDWFILNSCDESDNVDNYSIDIDWTDWNIDGFQCSTLYVKNGKYDDGIWQEWTNRNGKADGKFDDWRFSHGNATSSLFYTHGNVVDGGYNGEVILEFTDNSGVQHTQRATYKDGYAQQIGTWRENGLIIYAMDENDNPVGGDEEFLGQRLPFNN